MRSGPDLFRGNPDIRLPRVIVATDGKAPLDLPPSLQSARLLRDLDLPARVAAATSARPPLAVDIDTVLGLNSDAAGVDFVTGELGLGVIATRRASAAAAAAERGCLGLFHVFAFDSTGLYRALEAHPRRAGVGTMISPGPVLTHMLPEDLDSLPRPVVAYGLIATAEIAAALLARAEAVVVSPTTAARLPWGLLGDPPQPAAGPRPAIGS
ncbi:MAG: glycerol-3-phosphate responsive antiterminator [Candidatus Limnocylindrales bacterium]